MATLWIVLRWIISSILLIDGLFLIFVSIYYLISTKRRKEEYKNTHDRLGDGGVLAIFGGSGIVFLLLLFVTVPL